MDRRHFIAGSLASITAPALAAPLSQYGLDAAQFGVRPGAPDDQTAKLQRAIGEATRTRTPLVLAPGVYRVGGLQLWTGAQLVGVRGATFLTFTGGNSLVSAENSDAVTLSGLTFQGGNSKLPDNRGLVHCSTARGLRITDCEVHNAGGNGIVLEQCDGAVTGTTITDAADNALLATNSRGLVVSSNVIRGSGNGGIRVWQSDKRHDGTIIADNRIEDTHARAGGDGQNGNAINVYRAGNVIVRGNQIRKAAFSAVRGNAASGIQIVGNNCAGLDDVALYSEFGFQGAVIADNVIDEAGTGVSVTNFDDGGRLASVRGNMIRNLRQRIASMPPEGQGVGIARRGRHRRDRQCHRDRGPRRHPRRLGPLSAQRHHQRQCGARGRRRHRSLGRVRRRRRQHHRQHHHRQQARRHSRHGMGQSRDRRPRQGGRRALSAADHRQ